MLNEMIQVLAPLERLETELHELEVDTFEIEDLLDLGQNAFTLVRQAYACSTSNCCSSCCSSGPSSSCTTASSTCA